MHVAMHTSMHTCKPPFAKLQPAEASSIISCQAQKADYGVRRAQPAQLQKSVVPDSESAARNVEDYSFWSVVASSQAFATQLVGHFSKRSGTQMQQAEKLLQEASSKEREKQRNTIPADITSYLHAVAVWEMKHIRKLSHLCSMTYDPRKVNDLHLKRCHNLDFVTSSWSHAIQPFEPRTAQDVQAEGDGMAAGFGDAHIIYNAGTGRDDLAANVVPAPALGKGSYSQRQVSAPLGSAKKRAEAVAAKLTEAAMAAAAAAAAAAIPLASVAGNMYAGLTGSSSQQGASMGLPVQAEGSSSSSTQSGSGAASRASAQQASYSFMASSSQLYSALPPPAASAPASSASAPLCPSEWFVCDDHAHHLRIFVIQGSDTIDHWRLNLTFDPVTFEDAALGVTVHRGVYEAGQVLYDKFLPLVYEHLDSSPFARVTFTGHSIGGSLATLLMLMFKKRGVLTNPSIATVYTFGAPSMFCEGQQSSCAIGAAAPGASVGAGNQASSREECVSCHEGGPSRLLVALGLKDQVVRNVMMHRDIVPRAFACDYSLVADILKSWGSSFRDHCCLGGGGRKHLYYFVGRMIVLQPDGPWHAFVANDPDHPLLPPGPGMYYLADPSDMLAPRAASAAVSDPVAGSGDSGPGRRQGSRVPESARQAVLELMDCPHPLETLADPAAYLEKGSISRFHNPDHYTRAFGRIIFLRRRQEGSSADWAKPAWVQRQSPATSPAGNVAMADCMSSSQSQWDSSDAGHTLQDHVSLYVESSCFS